MSWLCLLNLKILTSLLYLFNCQYIVRGTCDFGVVCGLSSWLDWNCTCCGANVRHLTLATRAKAICCPDTAKTNLKECTRSCNISPASISAQGLCSSYCTNEAHPSPCYIPSTTSTTQATTAITTSSTSTRSRLTTTSSTSTAPTPAITTVTTLPTLSTSPATSTTFKQSTSKITPIRTTTMADQQSTSELTTQTTIASVVWSSNNPITSISKLSPQTTAPNHNGRKRFCVIGLWKFVVYENEFST